MNVSFEERAGRHGRRLGIATLDAAQSLNALSLPMLEVLAERLLAWQDAPEIACVVLRASGGKAFCAGADVRQLAEACRARPGEVPALARRFFATEYRLLHRLHHYRKPLLCWTHGYVMGGGLGLLQSAGLRIVTPSSRLAMPEIGIGLYPDVGASWFLNRLPGRLGLFVGLSACQLNARDALDLGLADRFLADAQQDALRHGLAQLNWDEQPASQLHSLLQALENEALAHLPSAQLLPRRERIDRLLDVADLPSAWQALAARRDDADPLLASAAASLRAGCPLTAHLLWQQLRRARFLSLADALRMEYALSLNCCRHPEFAEGVRARLIDRDNRPRWHWPDVARLDAAVVEAHFAPAWEGEHPLADLRDS